MIFVWYPLFVFICFKRDFFAVRILINWVFELCFIISFISLERLFKLLSSLFLLYTFSLGVKSKFLFKSFTLIFWERKAVKLTAFPSGSDLNLIDSSIFLRNWKKVHIASSMNEITPGISVFSIWLPVLQAVGPFLYFIKLFVQFEFFVNAY